MADNKNLSEAFGKRHTIFTVVLTGVLVAILIWVTIAQPYNNSPPIRSDGVGYHIWVHAFKNQNFNFCKYKEILDPTGSISVVNSEKSICGLKYPPGVGLLQFPFTVLWSADDANLGYSLAEHWSILWLGSALLLLTCFFSFKSLGLLGCKTSIRLFAITVFIFGSGLFHYSTYDASFSHIYSAFGVSALLWLSIKSKEVGWDFRSLLFFGVLVFWLYLVRQTNGVITFAIVLLTLQSCKVPKFLKYKYIPTLVWAASTATAMLILVAYNYYVTGEIRISSYGNEKFISIGKYFYSVIFSYERGLITYYPLYLVTSLLAMSVWGNLVTYIFVTLEVIFAVVYGSWHSWFLGGGMGHRGFVELAPLGILALGMSMSQISKLKQSVIITILIICCYITLAVMVGYWKGTFPFSGATSKVYWSHILSFIHKE